jgi:hypothetical protein
MEQGKLVHHLTICSGHHWVNLAREQLAEVHVTADPTTGMGNW